MRSALSIAAMVIAFCAAAVVQAQGNLAATPQGKAVLAYYKAAHSGDLAALKKCLTAESVKELEGPKGKEILGMMKEMYPAKPPAITKVDVKDKTAMVDAKVTEGATTSTEHVKVVLIGTEWKVDTTGK
jgi:hypothetical protein